jgi:hypothetical protein
MLAGVLALMALLVVVSVVRGKRDRAEAQPTLPTDSAATVSAAPSAPALAGPAQPGTDSSARLDAPKVAIGTAIGMDTSSAVAAPAAAPERPGVPSLTRNLIAESQLDRARIVYVEPARRAAGTTRPMVTASPGLAVPLDEAHFIDGSSMRGRVEVVRAGTVIFRDVTTGLRHEINKDDLSEIITEFGTSVRFSNRRIAPTGTRIADATAGAIGVAGRPLLNTTGGVGGASAGKPGAPRTRETGVRGTGVGGQYLVRYDKATARGSVECTRVWQRAPNAVDRATVTHVPGADTVLVAFEGGDSFPSNIDHEGYFASTFRIVPDQARTSTVLTTRLNGQFLPDGTLNMEVSIVYFQRMRVGQDVTCNVSVPAVGQKQKG